MKRFFFVVLLIHAFAIASAAERPDRLVFKEAGFAIRPLAENPGEGGTRVLIMAMTPKNGFASNVNVHVQPYADSLEDYIKLSKKQFTQSGLKVIKESKPTKNSVIFEYTGSMQGKDLHYYARVIHAKGRVFLATATALESSWLADSEELRSCVDSLSTSPNH